jgi:hypothetical protein
MSQDGPQLDNPYNRHDNEVKRKSYNYSHEHITPFSKQTAADAQPLAMILVKIRKLGVPNEYQNKE